MGARKQYVSLPQLSARLGLPEAWLKSEAHAGRLPHIKAGRRLMFHLEACERALLDRASLIARGQVPT